MICETTYEYTFRQDDGSLWARVRLEPIPPKSVPGYTHRVVILTYQHLNTLWALCSKDWLGSNARPSQHTALYFAKKYAS